MKSIEEMIKELCPEGVEYVKLGEIIRTITPPQKLKTNEYQESGKYSIIDQGQNSIVGYTDNDNALLPHAEYVLYGDHTCNVKYFNGPFAQGADGLKILRPIDNVCVRYLYYALYTYNLSNREYKRHWTQAKEILIPLPPLPIQQQIADTLDKFTSLISNLDKEIELRQKQYEYYREKLLTFSEDDESVEWKKLGEVCEIRGRIGFRGYTRKDQVSWGEGALSLSPSNIIDDRLDFSTCTFITWEKYEESPEIIVELNDIIFCKTASVGKFAIIDKMICKSTINPQLVILKNIKLSNKYLYYCLGMAYVQQKVKALAGIGSVPNISQKKLGEIKLPIPSLTRQREIVSTLDKFEAVLANLKRERELRQKQYEYYREKLLTF